MKIIKYMVKLYVLNCRTILTYMGGNFMSHIVEEYRLNVIPIFFFGGIIMNRSITHKHLKKQFDLLESAEDLYPLFKELEFSTLLLLVDVENDILAFPNLDCDDKKFIPVFTDVYEYEKVNFTENFSLISNSFDFYLNLLDDGLDGIIIDVEGVGLPIPREFKDVIVLDQIFNQ